MRDPAADEVRDPRTETNTTVHFTADEHGLPPLHERAVAPWQRSFDEAGGDDDLAHVALAECLFGEGQDEDAKAELAEVMANKHFYSLAWCRAAELLEAQGEDEEALQWYAVATDRMSAEEVSRSRRLQQLATGLRRVKWRLRIPLDYIDLLGALGRDEAWEREIELRELLRDPVVIDGQLQAWERTEFDANVPWRNRIIGNDPDAYCHRAERTLRAENRRVAIATWTYEGVLNCLEDERFEGQYVPDGRRVAWPPSRNEPCWCGSAVKYKKCCGGALPAVEPAHAGAALTG
ncbi:SEC-C domain-containing protein [Kribbella karoonensis]|uniref:SEC-C motif-containing protein n=1 Tax=Kribbella karoonensis TaxID=324851 RepID=A0ABN2D3T4_9ACTN